MIWQGLGPPFPFLCIELFYYVSFMFWITLLPPPTPQDWFQVPHPVSHPGYLRFGTRRKTHFSWVLLGVYKFHRGLINTSLKLTRGSFLLPHHCHTSAQGKDSQDGKSISPYRTVLFNVSSVLEPENGMRVPRKQHRTPPYKYLSKEFITGTETKMY